MHLSIATSLAAAGLLAGSASAQISFGPGTDYFPGQRPSGIAFGDFDGDGDRDMAVTSDAPDKVSIFTNDGSGSFSGPVHVLLGGGVSAQDLVARDFDGDGDLDLAVALKNINSVMLVINTGGAFSPGASTGTAGDEPRHLAAGDLDGDGDMDLVVSNRESNDVSVLLNTGGAFSLHGTFAAGAEPRAVALADLDGDGDMDAAVSAHDDRAVNLLMGDGAGNLTAGTSLSVGGQLRPDGLTAADLDGDGDIDLAAATSGNGMNFISVFLNGGGGFAWNGPFNSPSGGVNPDDVAAADLDLDGDLDLATSNQDSNTVATLEGTGGGTFAAGSPFPAGTRPGDLELGDLDGNGSPDLAVANRDSNDVTVYLNDAAGGGSIGTNYCGPANPNSSGMPAVIGATGSLVVADNDVTLTASQLPANQFGYFLTSLDAGFVANPGGSQGNLCLSGDIGRYVAQVANSGAGGEIVLTLDLTQVPTPTGTTSVLAGETRRWQCWFRDDNPGSTSNFTDGIALTFQ